jgi:flagellar hook-basal body complex protein FliE
MNLRIDSGQASIDTSSSSRIGQLDRAGRSERSIADPDAATAGQFSGELGKAIGEIDKLQIAADTQATAVAHGAGNIHEMALALEKADVAMRLAMRVRNKLVDTYNEIMRMGI